MGISWEGDITSRSRSPVIRQSASPIIAVSGSFRISRTYEVPLISASEVRADPREFTASAPLGLTAALGIDTALTGVTVDVSIAREHCPAELDHIRVPVTNPAARIEQPSDKGRFKAMVQNGGIRISE